ncbi:MULTISPECIES: protein kinase [unclassified Streptomyces]|uniref:protein kinase domain-containing protein n=1 Tax=unclassified Streptomyces TaxID=2593676 RepID=UPI0037FD6ADC
MSDDGAPVGVNGRVVGGRYRLLERIGSGGMGVVWRARDELVDRDVAVKEPRLPGDPEDEIHRRAAHRLYREARAAARVDHPSAVAIHDVVVEEGEGLRDGLPWIVMELIRGESLHDALRRGPLDPAETARVGLAVLGALRAAHAVGIVHRDVKPANVLLGPHHRVVLTDFGIAHVQGEESLTVSGEFVGSLEFVAPERMSGPGAGPASDLWSLGVLLYAAVEGRSPFRGTSVESTLAAVLAAAPPEPTRAGPLGPLLLRLLAHDPEARPEPEEVERGLTEALTGASRVAQAPEPVPGPAPVPVTNLPAAPVAAPVPGSAAGSADATDIAGAPDLDAQADVSPEAGPDPTAPDPIPTAPTPASRPRSLLRRLTTPLTLLIAVLLLAAGVLGAVVLQTGDDTAVAGEGTDTRPTRPPPSTPTVASTASGPGSNLASTTPWTTHSEPSLRAVLALPARYREFTRAGDGSGGHPRTVGWSAGPVDVRLLQWDRAPGTPAARAALARDTWDAVGGDARTQTTRTTFAGREAALADTTYGLDATPTRVLELFVRTAAGRMYVLRVDMPKGTPDEKQGTSVFKEARDRLRVENS